MTSTFACWLAVAIVGLVAGVLSGGLGVGGGIIVVPALVLLLDCGQKSAQGMSLALMVPMALLGVMQYARTPGVQFQWTFVALLIAGALVGVLAGTRIMTHVPDAWLRRAFAVFLIIVAARMLWSEKASPRRSATKPPGQQASPPGGIAEQ